MQAFSKDYPNVHLCLLSQLKVFKNDEQPVVTVDSRKFAIDSSFQPSTVSKQLGLLGC